MFIKPAVFNLLSASKANPEGGEDLGDIVASYPGLLAPAFVACSTNVGEGLVKLSHVV